MPQKKQETPKTEETAPYEGFPDLEPVMAHIRSRRSEQTSEKAALLDKWLGQLEKIDNEMRQLEKIELFSSAVKSR